MFVGWCAGDVLWSDNSVEVGDEDPCGCKDTRVIDELDTVQAPENGPTGIRGSPYRKEGGSMAQSPPAAVHTAETTNRRSWNPLGGWKTMPQLPSHRYGGMTCMPGVCIGWL